MVNTAFDNRKVGADTLRVFRSVSNLLKKGSNTRNRVLTYIEYKNLLAALPSHTFTIVATAFWTGMRRAEILNLTWDRVDLERRLINLDSGMTKEGRVKKIPISEPLKRILMNLPNRIRNSDDNRFVFQYKDKRVSDIRAGLKKGCEGAGIQYGRNADNGFTFHDLRHSFATYARKAGVARNVIMIIMGHSAGNDMNFRYDTVDEIDLLIAVDQIEDYLKNVDHPVDQVAKKLPTKSKVFLNSTICNSFKGWFLNSVGFMRIYEFNTCKGLYLLVPKGRLELPQGNPY